MRRLLVSSSRSTELMRSSQTRTSARFTISKGSKVWNNWNGMSLVPHSITYLLTLSINSGGDNRQKGPSARADVHVTLEELYLGTSRDMTIARNVYCPKCRGTGAKDGKTKVCPTCNGNKVVIQMVQVGFGMQMQMQTACNRCGGRGHVTAQNCPHCQGRKVVNDQKTLTVDIERGMRDGDEVVFEREAEQVPDMI